MQTELTDWIFATHDLVEPHDYCTRELARFRSLTPEQQAAEEAEDEAEADRLLDALLAERRAEQERLRGAAQAEWIAFNGAATTEQIDAWKEKNKRLYLPFTERLNPVSIISPAGPVAPQKTTLQSAADLQHRQFAPVRYIVPGFIAEGLTILAGRPKVGKSWLTLDIALAVASGGDVLGKKAEDGDVLFLALEDNQRRLKSRIQKILGPFAKWPARFKFATEWPLASEGGIERIEEWVRSVPKPTLVVVDVLQRLRQAQNGSQNAYGADYADVAALQRIASQNNLALVVIHHLRKSASEGDPIDTISGTLGLSGAADAVAILNRAAAGVTLMARGRDIEEVEAAVQFDRPSCRWKVLGAASEVRRSDERKTIIDALKEAGAPLSPSSLADATGMPAGNVRRLLFKMVRDGDIRKEGRGYVTADSPGNIGNAVTGSQHLIPPPPR